MNIPIGWISSHFLLYEKPLDREHKSSEWWPAVPPTPPTDEGNQAGFGHVGKNPIAKREKEEGIEAFNASKMQLQWKTLEQSGAFVGMNRGMLELKLILVHAKLSLNLENL